MLFDLRGRRRRVVQVVYLMLALLLGGGLVLFGIGGDVSGGLVDAFRGGGGGQSTDSALEDRVDRQEERLRANPRDERILQNLVRDYYSLAVSQRETGSVGFPADARDDLRQAGVYWQRYAAAADEPSADTARYALQLYDEGALNRPKEAQKAAAVIAREANDAVSYLNLVQVATRAGDKRTADLAGQKAIELAPKDQKKAIRAQVKALKNPPEAQQPSG
jgi:tetratricopeptide (TPR) repeat protein